MAKENQKEAAVLSDRLKELLNMKYLTRAKLDPYNANKYLLKDIWKNNKKSGIHFLGWDDPEKIPFYPQGDSFRAPTSGGRYNDDLLIVGNDMVEYDFNEAYTTILRNYPLPSNTYLAHAKFTTEKIIDRLAEYDKPHPYRDLKTFVFVDFYMEAFAKPETFISPYGSNLVNYGKTIASRMTTTEVELKLIFDFYDVKAFEVMETHTFKMRSGMLDDYFARIEPLKGDEIAGGAYKFMRNKVFGQISATEHKGADAKIFNFPMYNRAAGAFVTGVFRDRMTRFEQKYVNDEDYKLLLMRTDALYFNKEVPYFEALTQRGITKRVDETITESHATGLNVRG